MARPRDESKIDEIRQAAMKLVIRCGFKGLKMAEVAKEACIATGTLYIYFKDKEALINEAYLFTKKEIATVLLSSENQGENFYISFRLMWFAYLNFCLANTHKMMFVEQFYHSGFLSESSVSAGELCFQPFNHLMLEAQKQGFIRETDVELLKAQLMGPLHEFVKLAMKMGEDWMKGQVESGFEMAWAAIRK